MTKGKRQTKAIKGKGQQSQTSRTFSRPVLVTLAAACVLSLGLGMGLHGEPHFPFEAVPGFDSLLGAGAVVVLVLAARALGVILRRGEDYYDQ